MDSRFALLLACFALSGFTALLYQTAWTRELSFTFGTSELAVAAVLAVYMGGLALGAAVAARIVWRLRRPVLGYGMLELAIAVSALAVPAARQVVDALYAAALGGASDLPESTGGTLVLQLAAAAAVLLPPTAFMGATLPLLARHAVRSEDQIGSRVGVLYAVNTAGAIAGTLCTAFVLLPELGLRRTVWVGAALNASVFALTAVLARAAPLAPEIAKSRPSESFASGTWILPAIALSSAVSFAYEVLWTRLLGHILGGSLDAFATILASFLLGIALGGAAAARLATSRERARAGFAIAQLGIALASYGAFAWVERWADFADRLGAGPESPLANAGMAIAALLPITLCIGATFPFAVRFLARAPEDAAAVTARAYTWSTVGAIAGALGTGFVLLPALRFAGTLMVGVAANTLLAAGCALSSAPRRARFAVPAVVLAALLALVPAHEPLALLRRSFLGPGSSQGEVLFSAVGRSSTVVVVDQPLAFQLSTNGLPEAVVDHAGVVPLPPFLQFWLGMLPVLVRPETRDALVVGLGGGTSLEAVPATVARIDVIELEPEILAANRVIAGSRARDPLADPRVRVRIGDARGTLQLCAKRYGAIVSQPSHPWTAGASHLYTKEFFSLVRSHLQPDGVFVQWIGMPFIDESLLRSVLATLDGVFGHVELYSPTEHALLFVASAMPIAGLTGARRALRTDPADYARFGVRRIEDFATAWLLDETGVRALAAGAAPNTDDDNQLAVRAARLGDDAMSSRSALALFAPLDPLIPASTELDRGALIRRLVRTGQTERARSVAKAADGADAERALGWLDLASGRVRNAARHFERARELAPEDGDALVGMVASHHHDLIHGPVPEIAESQLDAPVASVIAGWRRADSGDGLALAALDAELATFGPGDALFQEAARLRARWRIERSDPSAGGEATAILESSLIDFWRPEDALWHARAAANAEQPLVAIASLERIAALAPPGARGRDVMRRALAIANTLPDDTAGRVRAELTSRLDRRPRPMRQ